MEFEHREEYIMAAFKRAPRLASIFSEARRFRGIATIAKQITQSHAVSAISSIVEQQQKQTFKLI